jgi:hypothetical protein
MIAARPIQDLTRGLGRNAFDLPVAALAGLAAAVIAFAAPADLLGHLISATGLPHLLAAAEPPLGLKARAGIGIAGAAAAFGLVFIMMRMLDGAGRKKAQPEPELDEDEMRPRLRRRDLHPDAPVCRPISATRDFGEPAPPPLEPAVVPAPAEEFLPAWFHEADAEALELQSEPEAKPEPEPELHAGVEPEPEPEPVIEPALERDAPVSPQPAPAAEASIADLMRRLEQGMARRRTHQVFAPAQQQQQPAPAPQVFPEANDDRLQSAIESLQRFAARGD